MESSIHEPSLPRDGGSPSFETAIADLRTALAVCRADPQKQAQVPHLIVRVGQAAKARGMKPETATVALRTVWDREVSDQWRVTSRGSNLTAYRAIDMLLDAYFADCDSHLESGSDR
jgi:hypothetical protein